MKEWLRDKLLPAVVIGLISAAVSVWVDVKVLRNDVDRLEVYVDQLWRQK